MSTLTQASLKARLNYDPITGVFMHKTLPPMKARRTKLNEARAGYFNGRYNVIGICGKSYLSHRLAWLYVYGKWPSNKIDHIDGNPLNNAIANLRDVTQTVNLQNQKRANSTNKSSRLLGSYRNRQRWMSRITVNGKDVYLGNFGTKEEAHAAYIKAKRTFHEGCTI